MEASWITGEGFESLLKNPKYSKSQPAQLRAIVSAISDVDSSTQTFVCSMTLVIRVHDNYIDSGEEFQAVYNIQFPNLEEKFFESFALVDEQDIAVVTMNIKGKFKSEFLLQDFPFDYQKFSIMYAVMKSIHNFRITCSKFIQQLYFQTYPGERHVIRQSSTKSEIEWKFWNHITCETGCTSPEDTTALHPVYFLHFHGERNVNYYILNVFSILFLLVTVSSSVFALEVADLGDRLAVVITLLLTVVAFKFAVVQNLPKVPYTTVLDLYIFWSVGILSVVCFENSITAAFEVSKQTDQIIFYILSAIWIVFNIGLFVNQKIKLNKRAKKLQLDNNELRSSGTTKKDDVLLVQSVTPDAPLAPKKSSLSSKILKIVFVGDGAVGKTCLLISFHSDEFPVGYVPTVFDSYKKTVTINGVDIDLDMWDTAGQSDYDRLRPLSYTNTDLFFVVYDISNPVSLRNVEHKWIPEIQHHCPKKPFVLVGTKLDLRGTAPECVSVEEGQAMANTKKAKCFRECSALTREGVKNVFVDSIESVFDVQ